ncbi:MAG: hypothetical protein WDM89_01845 [Rhizomicrobium sp.]
MHQRRHEAELRLKAAETNLGRLEDIIREVEGQVQSLKRQARQAARYRNLSGHIRKAEALAHYLRWTAGELRSRVAEEALAVAAATVVDCTERAAQASTAQADAAAVLPPLRQTEAEKSAALHRLVVQRETLDAEETRAKETAEGLRLRIVQTVQDSEREQALDHDARNALSALAQETEELDAQSIRAEEELASADEAAARLNETLADAERLLERLTAGLAEWNAATASHERAREVASALVETSTHQLGEAQSRLDLAMEGALETPDVQLAQSATEQARSLAEAARLALTDARTILEDAERAELEAREPLETAERETQMLSAEAKALADLLQPEGQGLWPPMVDAVTVQPGYEAALAAALGDDLQAPLDESLPTSLARSRRLRYELRASRRCKAAQGLRQSTKRARPPPWHDWRRVPRPGRIAAERSQARSASCLATRRSMALGRVCRFRRRPLARGCTPDTTQSSGRT